ncbi:MAG: hypothetical protein ACRDGR_03310 [bacterium]
MRAILAVAATLGASTIAGAGTEVRPWVGFDFEHFGEQYAITADRDTVTTINDYGPAVGLAVFDEANPERRYRLTTDVRLGQETQRYRLDFDGRLHGREHGVELESLGMVRVFRENGAYTLSSDYVQESARATYVRRFGNARFRARDMFDVTWYQEPNEYNLTSWTHTPAVDLQWRFRELNSIRAGYRFGLHEVPDSTSLDYTRHTGELDLGLLLGWTASLDLSDQVDRRIYAPGSVRKSSWENRVDGALAFDAGDRTTLRLVHENELVRYDVPDDVYYDFDRFRTGFQAEVHQSPSLDLSIMPLYSFLRSATAPVESYTETGIEFGINWRLGNRVWFDLSDEIGRRQFDSAQDEEIPMDGTGSQLDESFLDVLYSDYIYNRLTLLVSSEVRKGIAANLFVNWQPEDHRVSSHDTNTRIVSGGIEYRF